MTEPNLYEKLIDLFRKTGEAHHQAFVETDGDDPEWPTWYAEYLHEALSSLLNASFTKSQLIYLIVKADREQAQEAPGSDWATFYASFFELRYAP